MEYNDFGICVAWAVKNSPEMKANEDRCELLNTSAYEEKVVGKVNRAV